MLGSPYLEGQISCLPTMPLSAFLKDTRRLPVFTILVIFLALIRTITEPIRLQYYSTTLLTYTDVKPYLFGALAASLGLLLMGLAFMTRRYKAVIAVCMVTIVAMVIIKVMYLLP